MAAKVEVKVTLSCKGCENKMCHTIPWAKEHDKLLRVVFEQEAFVQVAERFDWVRNGDLGEGEYLCMYCAAKVSAGETTTA